MGYVTLTRPFSIRVICQELT